MAKYRLPPPAKAENILELFDFGCSTHPKIPASVKKALTYKHKSIEALDEEKPWERGVVRTDTHLYDLKPHIDTERGLAGERLFTYAGLCQRMVDALYAAGMTVKIVDYRTPRPPYSLELACQDLYPMQAEDMRKMLEAGGGIGNFPTGYGKTRMMAGLIRAHNIRELHGRKTPLSVVTVADVSVAKKNYEDLVELLPDRDVGLITGSVTRRTEDVMVVSTDSLDRLTEPERVGVLIGDEVHGLASGPRAERIGRMSKALRWGLSATVTGRFDGADLLTEALFGRIVAKRTYGECMRAGMLVPITVCLLPLPPPPHIPLSQLAGRPREFMVRHGIVRNEALSRLVGDILKATPDSLQACAIMARIEQMDGIMEFCPAGTAYVHATTRADENMADMRHVGPVSSKMRDDIYRRMRDGEIRKCLATHVYKQGVNFTRLQVVICPGGGGSKIVYGQVPGRASRRIPGEKEGAFIVDFVPTWDEYDTGAGKKVPGHLMRDFKSRLGVYEENEFIMRDVRRLADLPFIGGNDG